MQQEYFSLRISSDGIKTFSAALHLLQKVGKEVSIEVENNEVTLRALNDAQSAFASIEFENGFFEELDVNGNSDGNSFSCKVAVKPICVILRNVKSVRDLIVTARSTTGADHELVFEMHQTNGVVRIHRFRYSGCEIVSAVFDEQNSSCIRLKPRVLVQLLDHFHRSTEICLEVGPGVFHVRSHHKSDALSMISDLKGNITTSLSLNPLEIDEFSLLPSSAAAIEGGDNDDCSNTTGNNSGSSGAKEHMVFCLREVRSLLALCEAVDCPAAEMFFTQATRPLKMGCRVPFINAAIILATVEPAIGVSNGATSKSNANISRSSAPRNISPDKNQQQRHLQQQQQQEEEEGQHNNFNNNFTSNNNRSNQDRVGGNVEMLRQPQIVSSSAFLDQSQSQEQQSQSQSQSQRYAPKGEDGPYEQQEPYIEPDQYQGQEQRSFPSAAGTAEENGATEAEKERKRRGEEGGEGGGGEGGGGGGVILRQKHRQKQQQFDLNVTGGGRIPLPARGGAAAGRSDNEEDDDDDDHLNVSSNNINNNDTSYNNGLNTSALMGAPVTGGGYAFNAVATTTNRERVTGEVVGGSGGGWAGRGGIAAGSSSSSSSSSAEVFSAGAAASKAAWQHLQEAAASAYVPSQQSMSDLSNQSQVALALQHQQQQQQQRQRPQQQPQPSSKSSHSRKRILDSDSEDEG